MDDVNFTMNVLERMRILTRVAADCAVSSGRLKRRLAEFLLAGNGSIPAEVRAEVLFHQKTVLRKNMCDASSVVLRKRKNLRAHLFFAELPFACEVVRNGSPRLFIGFFESDKSLFRDTQRSAGDIAAEDFFASFGKDSVAILYRLSTRGSLPSNPCVATETNTVPTEGEKYVSSENASSGKPRSMSLIDSVSGDRFDSAENLGFDFVIFFASLYSIYVRISAN